jgi:mono/diheme cytochrome c family protein
VLVATAVAIGTGCDGDRPFARMIRQSKAEPYGETALFADGAWMRPPPAGTVARGAGPGDPRVETGRDAAGRYLDRAPVTLTAALLERGRSRFEVLCAACHGVLGDADTVVAARMDLRRPPSLLSDAVRALSDGRIFEVASRGYGLMPSFAAELTAEERWGVVAYVRALELARGARLADLPAGAREATLRELGGR